MRKLFLILCLVLQANCQSVSNAGANCESANQVPAVEELKNKVDCWELDIRLLVISNEVTSDQLRKIEVFLDPAEFSRQNLQRILDQFSRKYEDGKNLNIRVYTDWKQFFPYQGCPGSGHTGISPMTEEFYKHSWAVLYRMVGKKAIRISTDLKGNSEVVEVE